MNQHGKQPNHRLCALLTLRKLKTTGEQDGNRLQDPSPPSQRKYGNSSNSPRKQTQYMYSLSNQALCEKSSGRRCMTQDVNSRATRVAPTTIEELLERHWESYVTWLTQSVPTHAEFTIFHVSPLSSTQVDTGVAR